MRIIFAATDYSTAGNNAVKYALQYSKSTKSKLVIFHSTHVPKFDPAMTKAAFSALEDKVESNDRKKLELIVKQISKKLGVETNYKKVKVIAKAGFIITHNIMLQASNCKADLIIMGTQGSGKLKFLGGNTSEVILKSKIPVLAIPQRVRFKKINRIMYAIDLKHFANELTRILQIAKELNANIEVINFDLGPGNIMTPDKIQTLIKRSGYKKIKITLNKGTRGVSILEQIRKKLRLRSPQILVMFPEDRSLFKRLVSPGKTEELIYTIKLPLLTFRKAKIKQGY